MSEELKHERSGQSTESGSLEPSKTDAPAAAAPKVSKWGEAAGAGAFGGAIAGMIASYGTGKLGLAGFVVFMFVMMGINGGSRKALATVMFVLAAALAAALFR